MSSKANLTLRWVSVSVFVGVSISFAVLGAIMLLVSISIVIGAKKVNEPLTLL